jgi:hypothetical protein
MGEGDRMIIIMKKNAKKTEIDAVIRTLKGYESYISKIDGKNIIVVK